MKVFRLSQQQAYELVAKIPPGTALTSTTKQKWEVVVIPNDPKYLSGRFPKTIVKHVNDSQKKSAILRCLSEIYAAACEDNFLAAIEQSGIECKPAHTFKFEGGAHRLLELKPNRKDRLYFYPARDGSKVIFLLMAFHKKDQQTPDEVSGPCEEEIKQILRSRGNFEFNEEKNVAKK
jgi:hypothetical protein